MVSYTKYIEWSKGFKACEGRMKCGERKKKERDKGWFHLEVSSNKIPCYFSSKYDSIVLIEEISYMYAWVMMCLIIELCD